MKRITILVALVAAGWSIAGAAPVSTNSVATGRSLSIDASAMSLTLGQATLTIGLLQFTNGVYSGDYRLKVFPYFLKNDRGRLAISVSEASLARIFSGKATAVIGTATTGSSNHHSRHIDVTITPVDIDRGTLKVWFTAGDRTMIFKPGYHFSGTNTVAGLRPAVINPHLAPPGFLVVVPTT